MLQHLTLLIKPAGADCPLSCGYCFYRSHGPRGGRMDEASLELLVRESLSAAQHVQLIWQGGEPALMGRGFFERAVALGRELARPGQSLEHSLQTSGTGLDESWIEVLRQGQFLVGLSVDGPRELHERWRGQSWERGVATAAWMLEAGIPVNALSVIARGEEDSAAERYAALRELGFEHLQFLPVVDPDPEDPSLPGPHSVEPEAWGRFLLDLWRAWWPERGRVSVRNIEEMLASYLGSPPLSCVSVERCGGYLVVEHDGSLHSCDFLVEPERPLARLGQLPLGQVLASPRQRALGQSKADLPEGCLDCPWRPRCHGGCPYHRFQTTTHLCASTRLVFEELDPELKLLARSLRPGPPPRRNAPCPCGSGLRYKRCCALLPAGS